MLILSTVKFLKVLSNSLLGGLFFCLLISLLLADLNINMKITPALVAAWTINLMPIYGLLFALVAIFAFFIIQFFFGRKLRIRLVSPSFLSLSFSLILLLFLAAFWANATHFRSFFDTTLWLRLRTQMVAFVTLSLMGLVGGVLYSQYMKAKANAAQQHADEQFVQASKFVGEISTQNKQLTDQLTTAHTKISALELQVGNTAELLNKIETLSGDKQQLLHDNELLASVLPSKAKVEELLTWKEQQSKVQ